MIDKVLLVCTDHTECVSAATRVYRVAEGFCLIDVSAERAQDPYADAARDAQLICQLPQFRPASADEVAAYKKLTKKALAPLAASE